jgi:hypothetical protein
LTEIYIIEIIATAPKTLPVPILYLSCIERFGKSPNYMDAAHNFSSCFSMQPVSVESFMLLGFAYNFLRFRDIAGGGERKVIW